MFMPVRQQISAPDWLSVTLLIKVTLGRYNIQPCRAAAL
jgi:hypothetical protein